MNDWNSQTILSTDRQYIGTPPASTSSEADLYCVASAAGVRLTLSDGRQLIDGMASRGRAIHGYNHPALSKAAQEQSAKMAQTMCEGLTHQPAVTLAQLLVTITPPNLDRVFFSDSDSLAVEMAMQLAVAYWASQGQPQKRRLVALQSSNHGDTFGVRSVSDPDTDIQPLFPGLFDKQVFAPAPDCGFSGDCEDRDIAQMTRILSEQHQEIAAVIVEPVVQGAGAMRFYSPKYLVKLRALCDAFDTLLIFDEIATGFGRTGKMFALEHAQVEPDILCLGNTLTSGYRGLAATLCTAPLSGAINTRDRANSIRSLTSRANPLACSIAIASVELLLSQPWQRSIKRLSIELATGLAPAMKLPNVKDVRTLGAIGVIELNEPINTDSVLALLVAKGVWVRPLGTLIYAIPAYIMTTEDVATLTAAMVGVAAEIA